MRRIFKAKTTLELIAQIYEYHGWIRQRGESRTKRVAELYNVTIDYKTRMFRAEKK